MKHKQITYDKQLVLQNLALAISMAKDKDEAMQLLSDLCTPAELQAMADRWLVVEELKKQKSYRQINEETGVSVTTIGRVARNIEFGTGGYNLIYKRVQRCKSKD